MKNIIITGTSRGIGFELVKNIAEQGHNVLALSRNNKSLSSLSYKNLSYFDFDITEENDFYKIIHFIEEKWQKK